MIRILAAFFVVCLWLSAPSLGATGRQNGTVPYPVLMALARIINYPGDVYIEPPAYGIVYAMIENEPITIKLQVINSTGVSRRLVLPEGFELPTVWRYEARRDGAPVRVEFAQPVVAFSSRDGSGVQSQNGRIVLKARDHISWDLNVKSELEPGTYRIKFMTLAHDEDSAKMRSLECELRFEVRREVGHELERTRRQAVRAMLAGDRASARQILSQMLRMHQSSFGAYQLLGEIEALDGNSLKAQAFREQALEIVRRGSDDVLVAKRPPAEVERIKAGHRQ